MNQQIDSIQKLRERWPEWEFELFCPSRVFRTYCVSASFPIGPIKQRWDTREGNTKEAACLRLAEKLEAMERGE